MQHAAVRHPRFWRISIYLFGLLLLSWQANAATIQTQDFGSAAVNGSGNVLGVTFSLAGLSTTPPAFLLGSVDYSAATLTCNSNYTTCTSSVTFLPRSPGLKQDALVLKDISGNVIASAFLRGIGTGPLLQVLPAAISTLAGNGNWNYQNGPAASSSFRDPQGLALDAKGNVYVADSLNQVIRKIAAQTGVVSTIAGTNVAGYSGDGAAALNATLNSPEGLALDAAGNLFIADQGNGLIRRIDAVSGIITTIAGGGSSAANGVAATTAALYGPNYVAVDTAGNVYVSDSYNNIVRKVTAATGLISTVAGGGSTAGTDGLGDGLVATSAQLSNPGGIAIDPAGNLYIADTGHSMVRRVDSGSAIITAVVGTGTPGTSGDGGLAVNAQIKQPTAIRFDAGGDLYIVDVAANLIRYVSSQTGIISTLAGNGVAAYTGDSGTAVAASLNGPTDLAFDPAGNLLVADNANNVIRKIAFVPPALVFPSTNVALTSAIVPVTIANAGNVSLSLSSLAVSVGFSQKPSGATDCSSTSTLAVGAACVVDLAFVPTAAGAINGSLTFASNNLNQSAAPSTLSLSGTALSGTPAATLSVTSLTFASQGVGTTSAQQTITLTNTGTAALSGINATVTGTNTLDFVVNSTCNATLAVNSSCTVSVAFRPVLAGTRTATLSVFNNAANSPQAVTLTGTATGGAFPVLSATALQFGSQVVSYTTPAQAVTVTNSGTAALNIYGIFLAGINTADFNLVSSTCSSTLAAGAACTLTFNFTPSANGARSGSVILNHSAGNSPQQIALNGTGTLPAITYSPATLTFPSQVIYTTSATQLVTLTNTSATGVALTSAIISGTNASDFALVSSACPATLTSASCTLSFTFTPTATGLRTATLTVGNNGANTALAIPLSATGVVAPAVIPGTVTNPGFETGTIDPWQSYIQGNGTAALSTAAAHSGGYGLALSPNGGYVAAYQDISGLTPNQTYIVSLWNKSASSAATAPSLSLHDTTGNGWISVTIPVSVTWQMISQSFTVGPNGKMRIAFAQSGGSIGTYWDDVSVTALPLNPGFEASSLTPWQIYAQGTATGALSGTVGAHSGSNGLVLNPNGSYVAGYQDISGLPVGQTYIVNIWVKSASVATSPVQLVMHDTTGAGLVSSTIVPSTTWQLIRQNFTIGPNGDLRVALVAPSGSISTYWDDLTIVPLPPDPGFENPSLYPWAGYVIGAASVSLSGAAAHSGSNGLSMSPAGGYAAVYQDITGLTPGQTYVVSVWLRSTVATANLAQLIMHDTTGNNFVSNSAAPGVGWQQLSQTYTISGNGALRIAFVEPAGTNITYWDDLTVVALPPDPGFENPSLAPWAGYVAGSATVALSTAAAHSGSSGLVISPNGNYAAAYQDVTGLTPGQTYAVSVWVRSTVGTSNVVQLVMHDTTGADLVYNTIVPGIGWQQITQTYKIAPNGAIRIAFVQPGGTNVTYWDDVAFVPLPPDPGFENPTLSPWISYVSGAASASTTSVAAHSGSNGLAIAPAGSYAAVYQDISGLIPLSSYTVSVWVRSTVVTSNIAQLVMHDTTGANLVYTTVVPGTGWQQISQIFTATANGAIRIAFVEPGGTNVTYWDDVTVVPR